MVEGRLISVSGYPWIWLVDGRFVAIQIMGPSVNLQNRPLCPPSPLHDGRISAATGRGSEGCDGRCILGEYARDPLGILFGTASAQKWPEVEKGAMSSPFVAWLCLIAPCTVLLHPLQAQNSCLICPLHRSGTNGMHSGIGIARCLLLDLCFVLHTAKCEWCSVLCPKYVVCRDLFAACGVATYEGLVHISQ